MARKALGPATLEIVQAVRSRTPDRPLLAAVSGGADSLALAFAVFRVCAERGRPAAAVTVDHGLQAGSDDHGRRVVDQLCELGFTDAELIMVQIGAGSGPEADARAARYRALDAAAAARDAELVLGHTLDDQAETVLLGLVRGAGPRSLAGMSSTPRRCRPLLGIRRDRTRTACAELGLHPWDDPHNADPRFTRSRIRHRVLPVLEDELGPGIAEALARTADLARADADYLDQLAADLLVTARRTSGEHDDRDRGKADLGRGEVDVGQGEDDHEHPRAEVVRPGQGVAPGDGRGQGRVDRLRQDDDRGGDHDQRAVVRDVPQVDLGQAGDDVGASGVGGAGDVGELGGSTAGDRAVVDHDSPRVDLDCTVLAEAPPALRTRVIKLWLTDAGAVEVSYERIRAIEKLITDWHGQAEIQLPGLAVRRIQGRLRALPLQR